MDRYRLSRLVSLMEVFSLQHPGHVVLCSKGNHIRSGHPVHPPAVEPDLRLFRVEYLKNLLLVSLGIPQDIIPDQRLPGLRLPRRVSYHACKIADEKDNLVSKLLELPEFVDQDGVSKMKIRGCRVKTRLYGQRSSLLELFYKL